MIGRVTVGTQRFSVALVLEVEKVGTID